MPATTSPTSSLCCRFAKSSTSTLTWSSLMTLQSLLVAATLMSSDQVLAAPGYCNANFTNYFTPTFWSNPSLSPTFVGRRKPRYFNTGVMVIDLERWRAGDYTRKIEEWMELQKRIRIYELRSLPPFLLKTQRLSEIGNQDGFKFSNSKVSNNDDFSFGDDGNSIEDRKKKKNEALSEKQAAICYTTPTESPEPPQMRSVPRLSLAPRRWLPPRAEVLWAHPNSRTPPNRRALSRQSLPVLLIRFNRFSLG
ncbi:hypothetical protein K1719_030843 [Acacia pycnantha]|nr:hypothetical protein K1719_030843 [Acacia pycnantha]